MKKWQKVSLTLLVILILIVIGTSLLLKSYLAPEIIKALVIPKVEEILNTTISYTKLEVGLGGTIKLKNLSIADPALPQQAGLLQSQDMVLHCRILPLFSKKIIIEEITLHQPHINLTRDKQGNYNVLKHLKYTPEAEKKLADKERTAKTPTDTTLFLTITQLNIKNGKITFTDYAKTSSTPVQLMAKSINLRASQISLASSFPLNLSAEIVSILPSFINLKALIDPLRKTLTIDKLEIQSDQMPHCKAQLEGKISVNSHEITIGHLKTTFQDSSLTLKGRINNYLEGPLTAEIHLNSPSLVLDDIIYCLEEGKGKTERGEEEGEEIGPFNFNQIKIKADISFDNVSYKNIHISDLKGTCRFQNNVLNLEPLEGTLADGLLHLKSRINFGVRGLDYTLNLTGSTLQLNPIMTSFAPDLQENIAGIVDLTVDLSGRGTTSDTFKKNLKGEGKIHIEGGKVSDLKSLQSLSSFIKLDKLDTLNFDQVHGTFQIKDGLVHIENSLKGKDIELYPQGTISLDANLDLSLDIRLSPQLSEQIVNEALTKYFQDERGWTVIALSIKGPSDEAVVMPASSTIQNISEMIIDIILKKEDIASDERQDKKKALENLLKELIKKSKERKTK